VSLATYAQLAVGSRLAYTPWIGAALEVGLIALAHGSAPEIARGAAIALGVTVVLMVVPLVAGVMSTARARVASEPQAAPVTVAA
jgi:hypothetical protein